MICTTLNKIRAYSPCESSWVKLLSALEKTGADDEPLPVAKILEICGLQDAFWSLRTLPEHNRKWRLLACDYAERALPIWDAKYPDDRRPHECIAVARRFANGEATAEELDAAGNAAWDAAWDAAGDAAWDAAGDAAGDAAWDAAGDAAWDAAENAAGNAARAAAWDAARAAARAAAGAAAGAAARAAAWAAAGAAAGATERAWQTQRFLEYLEGDASHGIEP